MCTTEVINDGTGCVTMFPTMVPFWNQRLGMAMGRVWVGYTHILPKKFTHGYSIINTHEYPYPNLTRIYYPWISIPYSKTETHLKFFFNSKHFNIKTYRSLKKKKINKRIYWLVCICCYFFFFFFWDRDRRFIR